MSINIIHSHHTVGIGLGPGVLLGGGPFGLSVGAVVGASVVGASVVGASVVGATVGAAVVGATVGALVG